MPEQFNPESFRGDFEALADVIKDSWGQNQNQSLLYDEPFLRLAFAYPGTSFDPLMGYAETETLRALAFVNRVRWVRMDIAGKMRLAGFDVCGSTTVALGGGQGGPRSNNATRDPKDGGWCILNPTRKPKWKSGLKMAKGLWTGFMQAAERFPGCPAVFRRRPNTLVP